MSAVDNTTETPIESTAQGWDGPGPAPAIELELELAEAEALRAWLLKPAGDGATSLEDPLVSRVLARLALEVDGVRAAVNVRHELEQSGFSVEHLSDQQVRELARRISDAASPGVRA